MSGNGFEKLDAAFVDPQDAGSKVSLLMQIAAYVCLSLCLATINGFMLLSVPGSPSAPGSVFGVETFNTLTLFASCAVKAAEV